MKKKIIIINGPNLNLLGEREQSQYGSVTYSELKEKCLKKTTELRLDAEFFQSNIEGEIIKKIHDAIDENIKAIIINAAAFTHTSVAILDALNIIKIPKIEIHLSNIYRREEFRQKSLISKAVDGIICGFGVESYIYAIDAMSKIIKNGIR